MKPILLNANATPEEKLAELAASQNREASLISSGEAARADVERNEIRRRRQVLAERDCGLIDADNGTYQATVVIQTNNLGIPGLVTSMDQIYEVGGERGDYALTSMLHLR